MSEEILSFGRLSSQGMSLQTERLKKSQKNLKKIEQSAVAGIDKLLSQIHKVETKHRLIIAFVIAVCISTIVFLSNA